MGGLKGEAGDPQGKSGAVPQLSGANAPSQAARQKRHDHRPRGQEVEHDRRHLTEPLTRWQGSFFNPRLLLDVMDETFTSISQKDQDKNSVNEKGKMS